MIREAGGVIHLEESWEQARQAGPRMASVSLSFDHRREQSPEDGLAGRPCLSPEPRGLPLPLLAPPTPLPPGEQLEPVFWIAAFS